MTAGSVPLQLSVIIPTLERQETAALLAERVRNLLAGLALEVIVVTPGAAPAPPDDRLRYVSDAGRGVYGAYDAGLQAARGEYVWFIGDDDYPLDAARDISAILAEGKVDLLVAPVVFSSGTLYRPQRSLLLLHFLNWCQQGVIYRRRELKRRRFFRRLPVQADQYINILMRSDRSLQIRFLTRPICLFGIDGVSGRTRDSAYRSLRMALAHRTLGCGAFLVFRLLLLLEPLIKRLVRIR
jgi:glycosyltransferase involved in cell wall biosynthesis